MRTVRIYGSKTKNNPLTIRGNVGHQPLEVVCWQIGDLHLIGAIGIDCVKLKISTLRVPARKHDFPARSDRATPTRSEDNERNQRDRGCHNEKGQTAETSRRCAEFLES